MDESEERCGAEGPRGLRCELAEGHNENHRVNADEPALPCDVCAAKAGEHCAEPRRCRDERKAKRFAEGGGS